METLDEIELSTGLWYSPTVKVYTIGGLNRVAEISTYPRAYEDPDPHLYTEEVPFVVTEDDCNETNEEGQEIYEDGSGQQFSVGETAKHFIGDPLPGPAPGWLESESLELPTFDKKLHKFDISGIPGPVKDVTKIEYMRPNGTYVAVPQAILDEINLLLDGDILSFERKLIKLYKDKVIMRLYYQRRFT